MIAASTPHFDIRQDRRLRACYDLCRTSCTPPTCETLVSYTVGSCAAPQDVRAGSGVQDQRQRP